MRIFALGLVTALAVSGCKKGEGPPEELLEGLSNRPGGNPLIPEKTLYPWPSDLYLVDQGEGPRLTLPQEALPDKLLAEDYAAHDGFTRVPFVLSWFPEGVDPSSLPSIAESVTPDSSVLLVDTDGVAVPVLAELDGQTSAPEWQALILRPQTALEPSTTYVAIIRDRVQAVGGGPLRTTDAFRALRDGIATDNDAVEAMRAHAPKVNAAIAAAGLDPDEVVLAWSFTTRSEEQVTGPVLSMHDQVMAQTLDPWVPISDQQDGDQRLIEGEIEVLDFLGPSGRIELDENGEAIAHGTRTVRFLVTIPDSVVETRPVIAFGHGFFSYYDEPTWGSLPASIDRWRMSTITTNFIGFNEDDAVSTFAKLGAGIGSLAEVADQQLQSHTHFTALARLVEEQLADDLTLNRGAGDFQPLDGDRVEYMGISNGGSQGAVIVAGSPAFDRGTLVVPGGAWAHMMQRAVQWSTMGAVLSDQYPDALELQIVQALSQQLLDPVDAVNYAPHMTDDPFPGRSPKSVTLHMAVADSQVANLVTEWVARSGNIPVITPSSREIPLIDEVSAAPPGYSGTSALFVYDEQYPDPPAGNVPPPYDNDAHESIRRLDSYHEQVGAFLEDGTIVQVCDGPCDPN